MFENIYKTFWATYKDWYDIKSSNFISQFSTNMVEYHLLDQDYLGFLNMNYMDRVSKEIINK